MVVIECLQCTELSDLRDKTHLYSVPINDTQSRRQRQATSSDW